MTTRLFAGKDYDQLVSALLARLRLRFPSYDLDADDEPMRLLIDAMSFGLEQSNFFMDASGAERFLDTAQRPSSVARIVSELGYNPHGATACSGTLSVGITTALPYSITLPSGLEFTSDRGLPYTLTEAVTWVAGETGFKSLSLSQSALRSRTFTSDGLNLQRLSLGGLSEDERISYQSLTVTVDGQVWTERDAFLDTDTNVYRVAYTAQPVYVEFGDGVVGTVPPESASIQITFGVTRGELGELSTPGRITGLATPLVVAGNQVDLVIDSSTGVMSGGSAPEVKSRTKALAPAFRHSDGAVCTDADFAAVAGSYSHGLYGTVASSRAVLATSIENDPKSAVLLSQIGFTLSDASTVVDSIKSDISALSLSLGDDIADLDALQVSLDAFVGSAQSLQTSIESVRTSTSTMQTGIGTIDQRAADIQTAASLAQTDVALAIASKNSLLSSLVSIGGGAGTDELTTVTYDALTALIGSISSLLDSVNAKLQGGGVIQSGASDVRSQLSSIRNSISLIRTDLDGIEDNQAQARLDVAALTALSTVLSGEVASNDAIALRLESEFNDPWSTVSSYALELRSHLDNVFTDDCGPNLVSVVILASDEDGYYVAPSIGLQRALEEYLSERKEPSVRVAVVDGSSLLISPRITVAFRVVQGYDPVKVKNLAQAEIFSLHRGRTAGIGLALDELYDAVREVEGLSRANIVIDGFDGATFALASIDSDGNLLLGRSEVITRPTVIYVRVLPDGSREVI